VSRVLLAVVLILALAPRAGAQEVAGGAPRVVVGSKAFAESWILGEALTMLARDAGADAVHRANLGGTEIVFEALRTGSVDVYPDYTGTIAQVLMKATGRPSLAEMRAHFAPLGIGISDPLGFNNSYALAVTESTAARHGLAKVSDLARHPDLRLGFTHEFIGRQDGWRGLAQHYGLTHLRNVRGIQHDLAYRAIESGQIDVMEIYTTDAKIERLHLRILADDRGFFPRYDCVLLYRLDLERRAPAALRAMLRLVGRIDERKMIRANALVELEKRTHQEAAAALLREALAVEQRVEARNVVREIATHTREHLSLVGVSLAAAIAVGIPLGIAAARARWLAMLTLTLTGLIQTIPSLALLAFLIPLPFLGISPATAIVALFLYSLLPIVRNTYTGLTTIPPALLESAEALGLPPTAQLWRVHLPLASPAIMAGIKTSAVINVGTATLAALIGAGGLGEPILRGISLVDSALILQGAVPAALLALAVQWGFDLLDRWVVPRGLRLPRAE